MNPIEAEQFKNKCKYSMCSLELDEFEAEAETIYKLARLGLIDKQLFVYMAMHLHSRSEIAGYYLQFFIVNKAQLLRNIVIRRNLLVLCCINRKNAFQKARS